MATPASTPAFAPETPASEDGLAAPAVAVAAATRWSPWTRLGFRFIFCYFTLYALCCGNATLWSLLPVVGDTIAVALAWPFWQAAQWLAVHVGHATGVAATLHGGGSGDKLVDWISTGVMLSVAVIVALMWTALDRRSLAYPRMLFWLRLLLRLTLGFAMLLYGTSKFFPLQMGPPSLAVLNEPLGNTSPMTMLWTLIGLNPVYEMICGAAEIAAGVLIVFRRTALLGTLVSAFLATNIVLYNFCYDVPVKLYALHLLLMCMVLLAGWAPDLINFFFLHRACAPSDGWTTPARRYGLRVETVATAVVLILTLATATWQLGQAYAKQVESVRHPSRRVGQWHVVTATLNNKATPVMTVEGNPMTDVYLEPTGRTMLRSGDGALWRANVVFDDAKHSVVMRSAAFEHPLEFHVVQPDQAHMLLMPSAKPAGQTPQLVLVRVPLPQHYPLLDRGFHLVNEWGLER